MRNTKCCHDCYRLTSGDRPSSLPTSWRSPGLRTAVAGGRGIRLRSARSSSPRSLRPCEHGYGASGRAGGGGFDCPRGIEPSCSYSLQAKSESSAIAGGQERPDSWYPHRRSLRRWSSSCSIRSMVVRIGPLASPGRKPRQARKGAAVAADAGAGVWLVRAASLADTQASELMSRVSGNARPGQRAVLVTSPVEPRNVARDDGDPTWWAETRAVPTFAAAADAGIRLRAEMWKMGPRFEAQPRANSPDCAMSRHIAAGQRGCKGIQEACAHGECVGPSATAVAEVALQSGRGSGVAESAQVPPLPREHPDRHRPARRRDYAETLRAHQRATCRAGPRKHQPRSRDHEGGFRQAHPGDRRRRHRDHHRATPEPD